MAADLTTLEKYQSPPVKIRSCQSKQEYMDFGVVLSSIFSPVDRDVQHFSQLMTNIPENNRSQLKLYVGYVNNTAVCTAALFLTDCAGVFDIATRPEYRQKGYGSAVFYHALTQAKNLGYQVSILQASPEGLGIYKRFGFKEEGHFNVWTNT